MNKQRATFAAGCFWGIEAAFRAVPGVIDVTSGYTGGDTKSPTYEQVCTDATGHAEAVQVTFDSDQVSYKELLETFFNVHDPTQQDGQGLDMGRQYRSAIFYHNDEQKTLAQQAIADYQQNLERTIVTELAPASEFYRAEEYHQRYFEKNGGGHC